MPHKQARGGGDGAAFWRVSNQRSVKSCGATPSPAPRQKDNRPDGIRRRTKKNTKIYCVEVLACWTCLAYSFREVNAAHVGLAPPPLSSFPPTPLP
ncbi:hypothetical protein RRG08_040567 [Elysia crispata]|uniref:Uncharacterized protein n=1 Tax=Elysia crispata TaxID=231223 RepID=A0AAE0Z9L2_9GAST|nr:hypothetical protein RRG08_040567 [Elysia crispata]